MWFNIRSAWKLQFLNRWSIFRWCCDSQIMRKMKRKSNFSLRLQQELMNEKQRQHQHCIYTQFARCCIDWHTSYIKGVYQFCDIFPCLNEFEKPVGGIVQQTDAVENLQKYRNFSLRSKSECTAKLGMKLYYRRFTLIVLW